jgi:acetyltransferase-like isoleucine patch superfamily enzyme
VIGDNVTLTGHSRFNLAGVDHRVILAAPHSESCIHIGSSSGMSGGVIYAATSVIIGQYVNIGANACIYDTDFHSLCSTERRRHLGNEGSRKPVIIENDAWIGARVIILKGTTVGEGAVVAAGSVVSRDIPPFTVWGGNPARLIKELPGDK